MADKTIPVADLLGGLLDHWVAKAEGHESVQIDGRCLVQRFANGFEVAEKGSAKGTVWEPSTRPDHAVPIMDREWIGTMRDAGDTEWLASIPREGHEYQKGPTLLIAAMRMRVAQVYGEEVRA